MRTPFDTRPRSDAATALDWMTDAACAEVGTEMFFPEKGGKGADDARKICGVCDVAAGCLAFALLNREEEGVWGGKSPRQRRRMLSLPETNDAQIGRDGLTSEQRRDAVRTWHARGESDAQIAARVGCNVRTVLRIRQELGLETQWGAA